MSKEILNKQEREACRAAFVAAYGAIGEVCEDEETWHAWFGTWANAWIDAARYYRNEEPMRQMLQNIWNETNRSGVAVQFIAESEHFHSSDSSRLGVYLTATQLAALRAIVEEAGDVK